MTIELEANSDINEPLIFELDVPGASAVDFEEPLGIRFRSEELRRGEPIGLPGLSEPQVIRHYTRLSKQNYSIDSNFYPLGSCTMKYNPRLNEKMARLSGFSDVHPFQPQSTVQGCFLVIDLLASWLKELTGLPSVAMSLAAGAHGELCGLMCIRAAHQANGEDSRTTVLVPESAHGTNPASAAICGYEVKPIPCKKDGRVDYGALNQLLSPEIAAVMITNPNTCGLFETDAINIANAVHDAGAYFYMDGANFNAIVGRLTLSELGVDAMHINLHKTFSTPHGGGGPGAGPTVLSEKLAPYAPVPFVVHDEKGFRMVEHFGQENADNMSLGRMKGFHGQFGVFVRALAYVLTMGIDGLKKASGDAVLNANYIRARLSEVLSLSYEDICMHEVLFDDRFLNGTDVSTLDFAKAMIDFGFHPPTIYFPLVVNGALLIEPTETESKETLDYFCDTLCKLVEMAKDETKRKDFSLSPQKSPIHRLNETRAARHPILRWEKVC